MLHLALPRPLAWLLPVLALVALTPPPAAHAGEVRLEGGWRIRFASNTDLVLDDTGARLGQQSWLEHRIRLTPKIVEEGQWEVQLSVDVLSGLVAGDVARDFAGLGWDGRSVKNGVSAAGFDFRHFYATAHLPMGQLMIGQMPNHWGMGLVANSGNDDLDIDFGDARFGDISERLMFATRPLQALYPQSDFARLFTTAIGADIVFRDRFAELVKRDSNGVHWGDLAFQGLFAALYDPSDKTRLGFYAARRWQQFANDDGNLHVWVFDVHARHGTALPALDSTLSLEAEGAVLNGATSHVTNLNAETSTRILQSGLAARARLGLPHGLEAEAEVGFASGDGNPFDGNAGNFQSNRDYKVSLVLFDEVLLFQSQNAARRLSDPNLVGRPPNGIDLLPTQGAVTNALYLKPTVRYRPTALGGRLRFTAAALFAIAPEPYVDAYQSLLASAPRNPFGTIAKTHYGTELDGGVSWLQKLGRVGLEGGVQAGVLLPGDAFELADGSTMGRVSVFKARLGVTF